LTPVKFVFKEPSNHAGDICENCRISCGVGKKKEKNWHYEIKSL